MYKKFVKRFFDFAISGMAILILLPFFLIFTPLVAVCMGGNPFFVQKRPGKNGKIFGILKYRTMTNKKDKDGKLLPDADRLTAFGKMLRKLSLDELPELFNIFIGQMSIVGPRPLLVSYLPLYNEYQARRHEMRPGLTGLAQVSGRNATTWEQRFSKDIEYVDNCSLLMDLKIIFLTVKKVLRSEGITQEGQATMEVFRGNDIKEVNVLILSCGRRVELTKCFIEAKKNLGIKGNVVCCDASETAPALFFADKKYQVPRIDSGEYVESIIDICSKENISLIVPTIDTELSLLAENKEYIEDKTNAKVLISNEKCITICQDKILSALFFADNNFGVPKTLDKEALESGDYTFPLFIKPKNGSSSINAYKIENKKELDFFYDYIKEPIVQECVKGIEYTVDVFLDFDSNIISCVPRQRLAIRSGEILKGVIDMNEDIINDVNKVISLLKPIGHITVQGFWGQDKVFRYIEINPRFGGGAPMAIKAGADSCRWLYMLLTGQKIEKDSINVKDNALFVRFDDSILLGKQ